MGILIMNMPGFSYSGFAEADGSHLWDRPVDQWAEQLRDMLFSGKFNSLFSLLFGIGFTIQFQRMLERDPAGAPAMYMGGLHLWTTSPVQNRQVCRPAARQAGPGAGAVHLLRRAGALEPVVAAAPRTRPVGGAVGACHVCASNGGNRRVSGQTTPLSRQLLPISPDSAPRYWVKASRPLGVRLTAVTGLRPRNDLSMLT